MANRLHLDFTLNTNTERSAFVNEYLRSDEFEKKPLTESEMETIADYILWGRNDDSGLNDVQEKRIQIATKHGTWDAAKDIESLDALVESPLFNEAQLHPADGQSAHYIQKNIKFSRDEALARADDQLRKEFLDLFRRIDWLDLQINYYDLAHGKRTKPIRDFLIKKFNTQEHLQAQELVSHWSAYQYLKQRHELVELRREQYTLRDAIQSPILEHGSNSVTLPMTYDWDAEIDVLPLGLLTKKNKLVFRDADRMNPANYSEKDLEEVSHYYWQIEQKKPTKWFFDFRDAEMVYQLFSLFYDMRDSAAEQSIEGNTHELMRTLDYYIDLAQLNSLHSEILQKKIDKIKNEDIAIQINKKYGKNYTANYISTIFKQKIIPQICAAAAEHKEIVGNLFFPEEFKTCSCCGRTYLRTADHFVRKSRSKDGLSNRCKNCDRQERQEKKVIELVQKEK